MAGYGTDAGFTAYVTANGYPTVAGGNIPAARQRGSAYIDALYEARFPGTPVGGIDQERAWPREDAQDIYGNDIDPDTVPTRVINASYEAAQLELANPGSLAVLISENERIRSIKAGSVAIEYAQSTAFDTITGAYPMYTTIEGLLYPLIGGSAAAQLPAIVVV